MNISPINFKGQYVYNYNESTLKNNPLWHKNSSSEATLGSYHINKTNMAYFADPMEPISDKIKEKADFVVYDNEPAYPAIEDVKQNYLGTLRKNFKDFFEDMRLYFYRREQGGFASKPEAQYKQWEAAECTRMYDAAGDLRYKKETAEDEINQLLEKKADLTSALEKSKSELSSKEAAKAHVEKHIENLGKIRQPYQALISLTEDGIPNENATLTAAENKNSNGKEYSFKNKTESLKKDVKNIEKTINYWETTKAEYLKAIQTLKNQIKNLQANIVSTSETIIRKQSFVEECRTKLVPLFEELKQFYLKQGIKGIKNL